MCISCVLPHSVAPPTVRRIYLARYAAELGGGRAHDGGVRRDDAAHDRARLRRRGARRGRGRGVGELGGVLAVVAARRRLERRRVAHGAPRVREPEPHACTDDVCRVRSWPLSNDE